MMTSNLKCHKCGGKMEEGFILDETYGAQQPSQWVEGEPEKSFWFGTKTSGKEKLQISTYRCGRCGYLESYALSTE
jgi:Domain of unknown function (DUF6487)